MRAGIHLWMMMVVAVAVAGCVTLTKRGRAVLVQQETPTGCQMVQHLEHQATCLTKREARQRSYRSKSAADTCGEMAKTDLRNQAGDLGANVIVFTSGKVQAEGDYRATASAYRCTQFADPRLIPVDVSEVRVVTDTSEMSECRRLNEVSTSAGDKTPGSAERLLAVLREKTFDVGGNTLVHTAKTSTGVAYLCPIAGAQVLPEQDLTPQQPPETNSRGPVDPRTSTASLNRSESKIGVGVVFGTGWDASALGFAGLRVPIHAGTTRVEPSVLVHLSNETLAFQLDLGLYYQAGSGSTIFYGGARGGFSHAQAGDVGVTNVRVGPGIGAEHFLADSWSLGFEAALMYLRVADTNSLNLEGNLVLRAYWD
jgi:hypothetical protein